jgi:hypothetical protein
MTKNFQKLCYQIEDQIRNYTTNEERKLYELQKMVETRIKSDSLPFSQDIPNTFQDKNNNNQKTNNLSSSPIAMDDQDFINRVLGNNGSYGTSMDGITTTGIAANYVINSKVSNINDDNTYKNALSCLRGNELVVPKNKFIAVKELTLDDINEKKIKDSKYMIDLKNKMKIEQYNNKILEQKNDKNIIKNNINNMKKKEKKNLEELISYSNNHINNMKQYQKEKKDLIDFVKKKLNKNFEENAIKLAMNKLSICEQNLNQIKADKYYNNEPNNNLCNWEERKEILEKEYRDTQKMVNNFLNKRGTNTNNNSNNVSKNKSTTNFKKKRNKSANPKYKNNYYHNRKY